jgi:hypothetical protein
MKNDSKIYQMLIGLVFFQPLIFFSFVLPKFSHYLFKIGVSEEPLYFILTGILLCLISGIFLPKIQLDQKPISILALMGIASICSFIIGLIFNFGFNNRSALEGVIITFMLFPSFLISIISITKIIPKAYQISETSNSDSGINKLYHFIGVAITLVLTGILQLVEMSITWIFYLIGFMYIILPLLWLSIISNQEKIIDKPDELSEVQPEEQSNSIKNSKTDIPRIKNYLRAQYFIGFLLILLYSLGSFTYENTQFGWVFIGVAAGLLIHQGFYSQKKVDPKENVIGIIGVLVPLLVFCIDPELIQNIAVIIILGLSIGFYFSSIFRNWNQYNQEYPNKTGLSITFFFILIIAAGFFARELEYTIRDNPVLLWYGFLISGIFIIVAITFIILSKKPRKTAIKQTPILNNVIEKVKSNYLNKKKVFIVFSLLLIIILPVFSAFMYQNSKQSVTVKLDKTMYTVNGKPVTEVNLNQKTAIILLNSPNVSGIDHGEAIRPRKSIRLGGYFYGLDGADKDETVDWFGKNMDVLSLGMCGATFTPEDILAIRALNSDLKFYYMAFATTLFEDSSSIYDNGSWGGSHYPNVKFNSTMNDWTVKYNNGSEANGVRRKSSTSNAHLMDLGKLEWADYFAWIYEQRAAQFHADGVAIDEVMWQGYWDTELEELRDYDDLDEIIDTCYDWLERLDNKTDMEVMTQAFWDESQVYQDGCWGEIAFRSGGGYGDRVDDTQAGVWYESMNWKEIVDNLAKISRKNNSYIWAAWYLQNDIESMEYAIATYLMGKPNANTYAAFHPHAIFGGGYPKNLVGYSVTNVENEVAAHPEFYDLELGDADGPMKEIEVIGGNVWMRNFTNGMVLVNPNHAHLPGFY